MFYILHILSSSHNIPGPTIDTFFFTNIIILSVVVGRLRRRISKSPSHKPFWIPASFICSNVSVPIHLHVPGLLLLLHSLLLSDRCSFKLGSNDCLRLYQKCYFFVHFSVVRFWIIVDLLGTERLDYTVVTCYLIPIHSFLHVPVHCIYEKVTHNNLRGIYTVFEHIMFT